MAEFSNGQIKMLHLLKTDGPSTASQIAAKLGSSKTAPLGWCPVLQKKGLIITKRIKLPTSDGKLVTQIQFALKDKDAELPPLKGSSSNSSSLSSVPEIQKLKQRLSHLIDEVQALESLVVTKKERQVLDYISKSGIKFKI